MPADSAGQRLQGPFAARVWLLVFMLCEQEEGSRKEGTGTSKAEQCCSVCGGRINRLLSMRPMRSVWTVIVMSASTPQKECKRPCAQRKTLSTFDTQEESAAGPRSLAMLYILQHWLGRGPQPAGVG
eukprot:1274176-Amphidinium_carterae.2